MTGKSPTFVEWEKLAARELRHATVVSLNRDYGGLSIKPAYFAEDAEELGFPGAAPFTRGIYPSMHRGRTWTQRQLIGLGTP